jgi:adenosylcobinamide kinase / adenosylcobinamide-phosphate guanylyltransferase
LSERPPALRVLVLGGIRSGKSAWAEAAIASSVRPGDAVRYVATGAASSDAEWATRLAAHRDRRPAQWETIESADVAAQLNASPQRATLVDDMGGWLVAAMDHNGGWTGGSVRGVVDELIDAVSAFTGPLVLVSPEVGLSVVPATASGRLFSDELGELNQRLAAVCDRVVLVIAGQVLTVKESQ